MVDTNEIDEYENYKLNTIKDYKLEISKYSIIVNSGKAKINDYASLFLAYKALYEFTLDEKTGPQVSKEIVDKVANALMVKIKEELKSDDAKSKGKAYVHLAYICNYQKDNKKALECLNRAVGFDKCFLEERGTFKNTILNDRQGALDDYNEALKLTTEQDVIELIKFQIEHIDIIRDTDKLIAESKWVYLKIYLLLAIPVLYFIYIIWDLFKGFFH